MIFKALTIGRLKAEIKDLPDDMPVYLENHEEQECMGLLSIQKRTLSIYDFDDIEALVLGIA